MANVNQPNSVPAVNSVPESFPNTPQPGKIETLYIANNRSIIDRYSPKTGYSNSLLKFGPRQPFVWYTPNDGNSGLNAIRKYDSRAFPIGSTLQDVIRISKYTVSGPGVIFAVKQLMLQNLQPHNETTLYNPAMPIVGALRPGSLGLLPRPTRHIDLGGGILGALASVVGFSVGDRSQSSPRGTVGSGIQDTADNSPLPKQSAGGGRGLVRGKTASSGYTSLASRWGGNASKSSFLKSMAASVFPSLISSKQPVGTGYRADEGAYGLMVNDLKGKFKKQNPVTGVDIPMTQLWIAGSSDGGAKNIRKKNETPQDRKLVYVDGTEQKIGVQTTITGPTINNASTGFTFEKDVDNVTKYGKSLGIDVNRLHIDEVFKYSIMLINYKKYIDKIGKFPTKMDGPPVDVTNADDKTIIQPQTDFYKKYGFDNTPIIFSVKSFTDIPTRKGSGDENRPAYQVDKTYSKQRKDDGGNGNLSNFKKNLEDNKFKNIPTSFNDIGELNNATLQQKEDDRIVKELVDDRKNVFTKLGLSDTPDISKIKTIADTPERGDDPKKEAYTVDGTYSNNRKTAIDDGNPNGNLADILSSVMEGKFQKLPTETTDLKGNKIDKINTTLQIESGDRLNVERKQALTDLINNIKASGYNVSFQNADTRIFSNPNATKFGIQTLETGHTIYQDDYDENEQLLDGFDKAGRRNNSNKKFSGAHKSDELNRLTILDKNKTITDDTDVDDWTEYDPYKDDLIAFYFYDMVNERHVPFRASITGINDSFQADWTNYEYIGRADKLYNYKGFTRSLSFNFKVIANSIKELLPMWKRINYLCGLTMPADYTNAQSQNNLSQNQFIVPPFVLLTIGDMYKEQPIIINRVGLNIPDGASWETLNETYGQDWAYLNNIISWSGSSGKYAQFPREVEISLDLSVLQKERAIVGSAAFGHSVRDLINVNQIAGSENQFSKQLMVPRPNS